MVHCYHIVITMNHHLHPIVSQDDKDTKCYDIDIIDIDPLGKEKTPRRLHCQMLLACYEYELARDEFKRFYKF